MRGLALAIALFALAALLSGAERLTESGEQCAFPIDFNGEMVYDCVSWNSQEWCKAASGLWGVCAPKTEQDSDAATSAVNPTLSDLTGAAAKPAPAVSINEILARPAKGEEDFIELINYGDEEVDLQGWTLQDGDKKDNEEGEQRQPFVLGEGEGCKEGATIAPNALLRLERDANCSFAFGLGRRDTVVLRDAQGKVVDKVGWTKHNALEGVSYGRIPDGRGEFKRSAPTPGEPNAPVTAEKLKEELPEGADVTGECCKKLQSFGFRSNLPVIVFDTNCQEVKDEPKIATRMCTCSHGEFGYDYDSFAGIEIRGSSSARDHSKKGMAVQLWNGTGDDQDFPLLGMPKDEDWVLFGPETDRSMGMRNFMAYNISRAMGNYASRTQFVEVFMQDDCLPLSMKDYHGIFVLEEKIKRHSKRVDVCKHKEDDITGGYIFKHDNDNIDDGDVTFPIKKRYSSRQPMPMVMTYPKGTKQELQREVTYLQEYLNSFERTLVGDSFKDPDIGYAKFIDVDAFVDYFLGTEITKNPDAYRGSTYMHKECGKPFAMGPMWDYNEAFGMCCGYPIEGYMNSGQSNGISGGSAISPNGWRFNICEDKGRCKRDPVDGISHWFVRLWEDPAFKSKAAARWKELRAGELSNDKIEATIDEQLQRIRPAARRNYDRWFDVVGKFSRWERETKELREWVINRMEWMDMELRKFDPSRRTFDSGRGR